MLKQQTSIAGQLYKLGPDEVLRRCVMPHEKEAIIREAHSGTAGGHFAGIQGEATVGEAYW